MRQQEQRLTANKVWVVVSKDLWRNTIDLREKKAGRTRTEVTPKNNFKRNESVKNKRKTTTKPK
jgi:hypothetical protein